ncbi:hypothetical protein DQX05_14340 [Paenibacillus thiaminolyticus]|uniref:Uncharacterized protein n=1 Tax=Paenibacillus thiaminolyticus TaxID=49283 RepID=A0A3A3GGY5_PANTH|nr:hypothetical protein DQX05_14340 [Paenibacillus thiaminolyticus]
MRSGIFDFFIVNFVVTYFFIIYEGVGYTKRFLLSVFLLIMVGIMDFIKHYMKRKNHSMSFL